MVKILLFFSIILSVHGELHWRAPQENEDNIVPGSIEKEGIIRAICKTYGDDLERFVVGKVVDSKCLYSLNRADDSRKVRAFKRTIFQNKYSLAYEVLLYDDQSDYNWVDKDELDESQQLFNASDDDDDSLYICRAKNYSYRKLWRVERGRHSGQIYGLVSDGACFYEYGGKGQTSNDGLFYTNNNFEVLIEN